MHAFALFRTMENRSRKRSELYKRERVCRFPRHARCTFQSMWYVYMNRVRILVINPFFIIYLKYIIKPTFLRNIYPCVLNRQTVTFVQVRNALNRPSRLIRARRFSRILFHKDTNHTRVNIFFTLSRCNADRCDFPVLVTRVAFLITGAIQQLRELQRTR